MKQKHDREVRKAISAGRKVEQAAHRITLQALSGRPLDAAAARKVAREALHAVARAAAAPDAGRAARRSLQELGTLARASGTDLGHRLRNSGALAERMTHAGRAQLAAGLDAAAASGALLARAASGVLVGMADALAANARPRTKRGG